MKRHYTIFLILVFLIPSSALGQAPKNKLVLNTGLSIISKPNYLQDHWNNGLSVSGGYGYMFNKNLEIRGMVQWNNWSLKEDVFYTTAGVPGTASVTVSSGSSYTLSGIVNFLSYFDAGPPEFLPYFSGGLSIVSFFMDDAELLFNGGKLFGVGYTNNTVPGLNFGTGFEVVIDEYLSIALETVYTIAFTPGKDTSTLVAQCCIIIPLR